jgi:hypothetical protein
MKKPNNTVPPYFTVQHAAHGLAISGLTAVRAGLYDALKLMYWQNNCSLPFGMDDLHRLRRCLTVVGYEDADLIEVLEEYFPDGHHADLDEQRFGITQTRLQAQAAANKRWGGKDTAVHKGAPSDMFDQAKAPTKAAPLAPKDDPDF